MKRELREQARRMRQEGMSLNDIAKTLGVSKSSASLWVRDVELTEEQKTTLDNRHLFYKEHNRGAQANRARYREIRQAYQEVGRAKARENHPLHQIGCMLYWAEGMKGRHGVYFVNSDPNMMLVFVRFLKEEIAVKSADIALRIHCHTNVPDEVKRIEEYWLGRLNLPAESLKKTYLIKPSDKPGRKILKNGICDIRVHSTELIQHIYGAIQEYGGFDNPDWLF